MNRQAPSGVRGGMVVVTQRSGSQPTARAPMFAAIRSAAQPRPIDGAKLRAAREAAGLSRAMVSLRTAEAGERVSAERIEKIETEGSANSFQATIEALARAIGVDPESLR